jgi:hypothetical protein
VGRLAFGNLARGEQGRREAGGLLRLRLGLRGDWLRRFDLLDSTPGLKGKKNRIMKNYWIKNIDLKN